MRQRDSGIVGNYECCVPRRDRIQYMIDRACLVHDTQHDRRDCRRRDALVDELHPFVARVLAVQQDNARQFPE